VGGEELQPHLFLTSVPDTDDCPNSRPGRFTPRADVSTLARAGNRTPDQSRKPKKTVITFLSRDRGFINTLCVVEQIKLVDGVPVFYGNFAYPVSVFLPLGVL
jgi:hypothetical protein